MVSLPPGVNISAVAEMFDDRKVESVSIGDGLSVCGIVNRAGVPSLLGPGT